MLLPPRQAAQSTEARQPLRSDIRHNIRMTNPKVPVMEDRIAGLLLTRREDPKQRVTRQRKDAGPARRSARSLRLTLIAIVPRVGAILLTDTGLALTVHAVAPTKAPSPSSGKRSRTRSPQPSPKRDGATASNWNGTTHSKVPPHSADPLNAPRPCRTWHRAYSHPGGGSLRCGGRRAFTTEMGLVRSSCQNPEWSVTRQLAPRKTGDAPARCKQWRQNAADSEGLRVRMLAL